MQITAGGRGVLHRSLAPPPHARRYKALGTVAKRSPADPAETVPISTLKVLSANVKLLFVRSRESMHWRRIDVSRIDFSAKSGAAPKSALVSRHQFEYTDVTDELL